MALGPAPVGENPTGTVEFAPWTVTEPEGVPVTYPSKVPSVKAYVPLEMPLKTNWRSEPLCDFPSSGV
jgi:hypothetical protein